MRAAKPIDVLGVTSFGGGFHDSSVAWVRDGKIEFALSEERISRVKHDYAFPRKALAEALKFSKLAPADFAGIAVGWMEYNPFSGFFSRNLFDVPRTVFRGICGQPRETLRYAARNFAQKKLFAGQNLLKEYGFTPSLIHGVSHHRAHASSSYRTSGFEEALSVNLDCFGPDEYRHLWSGAVFICVGNKIELLENLPPYASLGLFYSAVSVCLGFKFGDGEGKTMGLAAYGDPERVYKKLEVICPRFHSSNWIGHESWSDFRLIDNPTLLFGSKWGSYIRTLIEISSREDVAAAAQKLLEDRLISYFEYLFTRTKIRNIVLAGGIFLNVTFNRKLAQNAEVRKVFVHPFASDGGTAAGAALELSAKLNSKAITYSMPTAALGPEFNEQEVLSALLDVGAKISYQRPANLPLDVAELIKAGNIVGWFQGRAEWGPRALGCRSVLGDPRLVGTRERLNKQLKSRDWFMPFAPSILEEFISEYLVNAFYTPFMTFSFQVRKEKIAEVPEIVHRDGTARPHVVRQSENPLYYNMISSFRKITGVPIVLNTSFNRHGLPLVHTPSEAVNHLLWGCVDLLAIGPFIVRRESETESVDKFAQDALLNAYSENQGLKVDPTV